MKFIKEVNDTMSHEYMLNKELIMNFNIYLFNVNFVNNCNKQFNRNVIIFEIWVIIIIEFYLIEIIVLFMLSQNIIFKMNIHYNKNIHNINTPLINRMQI